MSSHKEKAVYVLANMHPKRQTAPVNKLLNKAIEKNFMKNSDHGFFSHTDLGGKRVITLFSARQDGLFDALFHDDELNDYRVYKSIEWDCVPEKRIYPFTRMPIPEITDKSQWYPIYSGEYVMSDDKYAAPLNDFMTGLQNAISERPILDRVDDQLVRQIMFEGLFLHGAEPYNKLSHVLLDIGDAIVNVGPTSGGEVMVTYLDNDALLCKGYVPVMYSGDCHKQTLQETTTMTHQMLDDRQPVKERDEDVQVEADLDLPAYNLTELTETISSALEDFFKDNHIDALTVKELSTKLVGAVTTKGEELHWKNETEAMFTGHEVDMEVIHFIFRCLNEGTCRYYSKGMLALRDIMYLHRRKFNIDGITLKYEGVVTALWSSDGLVISIFSNTKGVSPLVEFSVDGEVVDFNLWLLEAAEKERNFDPKPHERNMYKHEKNLYNRR